MAYRNDHFRIIVTTGKLWDSLQLVTSILSGPVHTPMRQKPIGDPKRSNKMNSLYFNGIIIYISIYYYIVFK